MKITVEFENLKEFENYMNTGRRMMFSPDGSVTVSDGPVSKALSEPMLDPSPVDEAAADAVEKVKAEQKEAKAEQKEAKAEQKEAKAEQKEAKAEREGPVLDENYRLKVRKALATLNKMQTGNPAKKLIEATGYKRLTEVPLELLPGLLQNAEEAMKDA